MAARNSASNVSLTVFSIFSPSVLSAGSGKSRCIFSERSEHYSFVIGFLFTAKLFWDKMNSLYFSKVPLKRDISEQPLFYLALVAVIIGVQLFVTGFLAEMIAMQSLSKRDYLVIDKVGLDEDIARKELRNVNR